MERFKPIASTLLALAILSGCETAPVTGRSQLILVGDEKVQALGLQAYNQMKQEMPRSSDRALNRRVQNVGKRIAAISPKPDWEWEFTLFENDSPNAFALPGGKVGVNTGLFKVAKNDDQLAAVMGHEVAHAIAKHGNERMSKGILAQGGVAAAGIASGGDQVTTIGAALAAQYLFTLPNSRVQESEADHIGLLYMAEAGYDPRASVDLWRNMQEAGAGGQLEWMSTHPAPGNRIKRLEELMPAALEVYKPR